MRVNSGRRMFSRCPGESINARCATATDCAYARFSPARAYVIPAAFSRSKGEPAIGDSWLKYFGHESPVAGSPFDRLKAAGITYARAGENLAYAQSVAVAHRALMDSPGHRENILRPEFTRIGIGVISAGAYGRMVTQLFITP